MSSYLFNVISQRNYIFLAQFLSVCVYATVFLKIKETITFKQNRFIFFPPETALSGIACVSSVCYGRFVGSHWAIVWTSAFEIYKLTWKFKVRTVMKGKGSSLTKVRFSPVPWLPKVKYTWCATAHIELKFHSLSGWLSLFPWLNSHCSLESI